ncbi:hypothetical protein MUJ63_11655 [Lachnospiraceae bacterium NSJ-143]|nr:hypothetical protein [Lachnospiraceae bacterium NSJ-143]
MNEAFKNNLKHNLKHNLKRRTTKRYLPGKKENTYFNRIFFQACTCAVLIAVVFAVVKFGGENAAEFKSSLKNAIESNLTKNDINAVKVFIEKSVSKIKKSDAPDKSVPEKSKAAIKVENTNIGKGMVIVENNTSQDESISPG